MFVSTVGFLTELRFLRQRPLYMHCCRALMLALAKLSCLMFVSAVHKGIHYVLCANGLFTIFS